MATAQEINFENSINELLINNAFLSSKDKEDKKYEEQFVALSKGLELMKEVLTKIPLSKIDTTPNLQNENRKEAVINAFNQGMAALNQAFDQGASPGNALRDALLAMAVAMGGQKLNLANYEQELSKIQNDLDTLILKHVEIEGADAAKKYEDEWNKEHEQSIFKWIAVGLMAVAAIALLATGNVVTALVMVSLTILVASGGMEKLTNALGGAIAKQLEKDGMSKEDAEKWGKVIAAAIITVIIAIVGFGAGALDAAASAGAEAGNAGDEAAETGSILKSGIKGGISFGINGLSQTDFVQLLFNAIPDKDFKNKKEKEIVEGVVEGLVALASLAASFGAAATSSGGTAALGAKVTNGFRKLLNMSYTTLTKISIGSQIAAQLGEGGSQIGTGIVNIQLGEDIKDLAQYKEDLLIDGAMLEQGESLQKHNLDQFNDTMKNDIKIQGEFAKSLDVIFGAANKAEARA